MSIDHDKKKFAALLENEQDSISGIGTYNEKSLHKILKAFFCDYQSLLEVPVGPYLADIKTDDEIIEIQTGSFYPLAKKIAYYLANTDCKIKIVHPIICKKEILRVDKESGELIRKRTSTKHERAEDVLPELLWLGENIKNDRLSVELFLISIAEHRYSDTRQRYRKSGAYDSRSYPKELLGRIKLSTTDDIKALLSPEIVQISNGFTAAEFGKIMGFRGRKIYSALGALCNAGILKKTQLPSSRSATYFS